MVNESCKSYKRYSNTPSFTTQNLFYYSDWCGHFICNPDFCIKRKNLPCILILQTMEGSGKLIYRNCEYTLSKGYVAIINANDLHEYYPLPEEDWSFRFLHFSGNNSFEIYEYIYDINHGCVFKLTKEIDVNIERCISLSKEKGVAYETKISQRLSNILHEIILNIQQNDKDKITIICEFISQNYMQSISTQTLADVSNISRCHLSTIFKKSTGFTLHNYLLHYRLDKAKIMLREKDLPISIIAEQTGFNNTDSFIRFFKKKEKITPGQYRKINKPKII